MTVDLEIMAKERQSWSQWMTPQWAAEELIQRYYADLGRDDFVIEPSCGRGSFLKSVPSHVQAVGVEIDPELAREAEVNSGRRVIIGDFRTIDLPEDVSPTLVLGNPPFRVATISAFLKRAAEILPEDGRCGWLLPAYAMQTHRTVMQWHQTWSMVAELVPRRLFPRLSLPLLFVQFRKSRVRTMVGFALYQEAVEVEHLGRQAKLVLAHGRPCKGAWRSLVETALEKLGGQASLDDIYRFVEPRRPTENQWWREKVRQTLQLYGRPVDRGLWAMKEAA